MKQKSRLRRWFYFFGILSLLFYLLNGPIAHWAIKRYVIRSLEDVGLAGSFSLRGSIAAGFTLLDVELEGDRSVRKLYFKRARIRYNFNTLIEQQRVETLEIEGLDLIADIAFRSPPELRPPNPPTTFEILANLQPHIEGNPIRINGGEVVLVEGDSPFAEFSFGALEHEKASRKIVLRDFIGKRRGVPTELQTVTVGWAPDYMTLDHWEILPELAASDVVMKWQAGAMTHIEGHARLANSHFAVTYLPDGTIEFSQTGEAFDSHQVEHLVGLQLPANFLINEAIGHINDFNGPFPEWQLKVDARLSRLQWDEMSVASAKLRLDHRGQVTRLNLEAEQDQGTLDFKGQVAWLRGSADDWFNYGQAKAEVTVNQAGDWLGVVADRLPPGFKELRKGNLKGHAELAWSAQGFEACDTELLVHDLKWQQQLIPNLSASAHLDASKLWQVNLALASGKLDASAQFDLTAMNYSGKVESKSPDLQWLNPLITLFLPELELNSPPSFLWLGSGPLDQINGHKGKINLQSASGNLAGHSPVQASLKGQYDWPRSLQLESFDVAYGDYLASGCLNWIDNRLKLTPFVLSTSSEKLLEGNLDIPLSSKTKSFKDLLKQKGEIQIKLKSEALPIAQLQKLFAIGNDHEISGKLHLELGIGGDFDTPKVEGQVEIEALGGLVEEGLDALSGSLEMAMEDEKLVVSGMLTEGSGQEFELKFRSPLEPRIWLDDPNSLQALPLEAQAKITRLPLQRIFTFIPEAPEMLSQLEGALDLQASISGPFNELDWEASVNLDIEQLDIDPKHFPPLEAINLKASYAKDEVKIDSLKARVGGGTLTASGQGELKGIHGFDFDAALGAFDLSVGVGHAPVFRDDQVLVRANAKLGIQGTWEQAKITGKVGIVESLFFKDIELLPLGVPGSAVESFELPTVDAKQSLTLPEPFSAWNLDVEVILDDPLLIRGNLAAGQITGGVRLGGTLGRPAPAGAFQLENIAARLPFSRLKVNDSKINFIPNTGLNPQLEIRGRSRVGNHDINIFAYGPISNPSITLSSSPPLPEAEILTLLASGTTISGLEDQEVASAKAFQFLLMEVKQRANRPGGNKLFADLLSVLDNIDVNFGQAGAFTNRRYHAASIRFSERWNFTAMFDRENNTRGLVVFSIRLK